MIYFACFYKKDNTIENKFLFKGSHRYMKRQRSFTSTTTSRPGTAPEKSGVNLKNQVFGVRQMVKIQNDIFILLF